jgi:hypothetical protein
VSGGRNAVSMSEAEIREFLEGDLKVQVATIGPDGAPHLTTLFYVLDEGRLAFWTYGKSQKVQNLRRDPRISCLVEDGEDYFELRGVSVDLGDFGDDLVQQQARKRVGIVVEPDKVASWDHRKMGVPPGSSAAAATEES